jgi:hypothetical protein
VRGRDRAGASPPAPRPGRAPRPAGDTPLRRVGGPLPSGSKRGTSEIAGRRSSARPGPSPIPPATTASNSGGTSRAIAVTVGGGLLWCAYFLATSESRKQATWPVSAWWRTQPSADTSARASTVFPSICSGAPSPCRRPAAPVEAAEPVDHAHAAAGESPPDATASDTVPMRGSSVTRSVSVLAAGVDKSHCTHRGSRPVRATATSVGWFFATCGRW